MPSSIVAHLQQIQQQLEPLEPHIDADQRLLRELLSGTITALQALYPDDLTLPQRIQLLHQLSVLEEELFTTSHILTPVQWQHLHGSLVAAIRNTLANEASNRM
ncbi:hypothetical protein [Hymenobacter norwichensis]|uniref:hypothetical protein n=1 Tax=Hymenobacter norwichensis TaxID=223903 RepID=UPI0003B473DC|nr:hypothetical protein [Hymenobacter norwichensis]